MTSSDELSFVIKTIRQAGRILLECRDDTTGDETKDDGSLVTVADKRVSEYLAAELQSGFPQYGILDEEIKEDGSRFKKEFCWIVDPLDDTRGYRKGAESFGVIIALTQNAQPVLGVTYRPQVDELVYATRGKGAYIFRGTSRKQIKVDQSSETRVLISNSRSNEELDAMLAAIEPAHIVEMGGSLKIVEVAKGNATLFLCPATSTMHLWDLCAPQIILEEAGGRITDRYGNPFNYAQQETANRNGIIASNGVDHDGIVGKINQN